MNLGPIVNSSHNDYRASLSHDSSTLYFTSLRPVPSGGDSGRFGIWQAPVLDVAPFVRQPGDSNQDIQFDTSDIVEVLSAGKYETGEPATWAEGDWDAAPDESLTNAPPLGDGVFNSLDIIVAQAVNLFESGPYAGSKRVGGAGAFSGDDRMWHVPEPSSSMLLGSAALMVALMRLSRARRPGSWGTRLACPNDCS